MDYTKEIAAMIYGQEMEPCPKCGSYKMGPQTPIQIDDQTVEAGDNVKKLLKVWATKKLAGERLLEGPCYFICWDCFHRGPAVDCSGRTSEDVGKDPEVNKEMKRLWNEQGKG